MCRRPLGDLYCLAGHQKVFCEKTLKSSALSRITSGDLLSVEYLQEFFSAQKTHIRRFYLPKEPFIGFHCLEDLWTTSSVQKIIGRDSLRRRPSAEFHGLEELQEIFSQNIFRRFSLPRRHPTGLLFVASPPLEGLLYLEAFQKVFSVQRPSGGLYYVEELWEIFTVLKTFWRSSPYRRPLGDLTVQQAFGRSFLSKRAKGGLLCVEDLQELFFTQKTFRRVSRGRLDPYA